MEFDPLSRDIPPSRHAIESDSEDSEDELVSRETKTQVKVFKKPSFSLKSTNGGSKEASSSTSKHLIILVGSIGESYVRGRESFTADLALFSQNDGERQGSIHTLQAESTNVALLHPDSNLTSDQSNLSHLSQFLLTSLNPSKVTIIDEYHPALYLSDEKDVNDVQPIRILHSSQPSLSIQHNPSIQSFDAPNYITGLGAALLTESAFNKIPASLILVPQYKSVNPHLQMLQRIPQASSSIFERPESLDADLSEKLTTLLGFSNLTKSSNIATHTKPLDSFLHQRRSDQRKRQHNEVSSMYM